MKLKRDFTNKINWILDNLIPPIIRDSKLFMYPALRILYGKKVKYYLDFKEKYPFMTEDELVSYYREVSDVPHNKRETDLNTKCINAILDHVVGSSVLDIACGRGFLSKKICREKGVHVTGVDIIAPEEIDILPNFKFIEGKIEEIPFPDRHFDTVVSAHTIEHTADIHRAISELRRVTNKRLIIVVPRQREYKYTFDFHVHFFPYMHSLLKILRPTGTWHCVELDGDFFYYEDR